MDVDEIFFEMERTADDLREGGDCETLGRQVENIGKMMKKHPDIIGHAPKRDNQVIADALKRMRDHVNQRGVHPCFEGKGEKGELADILDAAMGAVRNGTEKDILRGGEDVERQARVAFGLEERSRVACFEASNADVLQDKLNTEVDTRVEDAKSISTGAPPRGESIKACILFDSDE